MAGPITVGVIGATGKTGSSVVEGLRSSPTNFSVTSLTRATSVDNSTDQQFAAKGVQNKRASGEISAKDYISEAEINQVIKETRQRLDASPKPVTHPDNIMDIANYNMGQYRIPWCIRGDNTPEYADYLGNVNFWNLFPDFPRGRSLAEFYQYVLDNDLSDLPGYPYTAAGVHK
ncbi:Hypothetical protein NCS54_00354000 [Fusarium falciforme]|uniref:Hypothetical protein n=1 Tax=Fusarium falciforme TaxID=195108 RepID=UPI002301CE4F|nr:Hypothetical protein NCS54_00354000 [Fusarium falciforme]WAO86269.1 Hypothetical protein NCS54_00354000 [Fusarium falciforme]